MSVKSPKQNYLSLAVNDALKLHRISNTLATAGKYITGMEASAIKLASRRDENELRIDGFAVSFMVGFVANHAALRRRAVWKGADLEQEFQDFERARKTVHHVLIDLLGFSRDYASNNLPSVVYATLGFKKPVSESREAAKKRAQRAEKAEKAAAAKKDAPIQAGLLASEVRVEYIGLLSKQVPVFLTTHGESKRMTLKDAMQSFLTFARAQSYIASDSK